MNSRLAWIRPTVVRSAVFAASMTVGVVFAAEPPAAPLTVRDTLWVWGNPEMTEPGEHTAATFAEASPAQRAEILGIPNVMLAGHGVPHDDAVADAQTAEVADHPRLLWEIASDGAGEWVGPPYKYEKTIARVHRLVDKYPQIEGVILDDMSSVGIDQGFKPEHIRQIRELLNERPDPLKIWGVVYTMNFDRPRMADYVKEIDVILLCEWHGAKLGELDKNVAYCEKNFPDKPIVLGTYLYDYGAGQRMPIEWLKLQYETALRLLHAGRIEGIEFTTITNDPEAVRWTADWIERVGDQPVGSPAG